MVLKEDDVGNADPDDAWLSIGTLHNQILLQGFYVPRRTKRRGNTEGWINLNGPRLSQKSHIYVTEIVREFSSLPTHAGGFLSMSLLTLFSNLFISPPLCFCTKIT